MADYETNVVGDKKVKKVKKVTMKKIQTNSDGTTRTTTTVEESEFSNNDVGGAQPVAGQETQPQEYTFNLIRFSIYTLEADGYQGKRRNQIDETQPDEGGLIFRVSFLTSFPELLFFFLLFSYQ